MLLKLYTPNPDPKHLDTIAKCLKNGGIIIYPTDSVYAIGCDIFQARAVEKICKIKGIDSKKAQLSMICSDISEISEYAKFDNDTFKLMKNNLPGAVTFILQSSSNLPKVMKSRKTIGIRVPDNNIAQAIISATGNPILSSSLSFSEDETEYATDPELIHEKYQNIVDIVIDGGYGTTNLTTIIDCSDNNPNITRQGSKTII